MLVQLYEQLSKKLRVVSNISVRLLHILFKILKSLRLI